MLELGALTAAGEKQEAGPGQRTSKGERQREMRGSVPPLPFSLPLYSRLYEVACIKNGEKQKAGPIGVNLKER